MATPKRVSHKYFFTQLSKNIWKVYSILMRKLCKTLFFPDHILPTCEEFDLIRHKFEYKSQLLGNLWLTSGFLCTMNSHSSQVKNCMIFFNKNSIFLQLSHICHRLLLSILQIYLVDIHISIILYSNYKESLIEMLMVLSLLLLLLMF